MPHQLWLVMAIIGAIFRDRADLVAENLALRHQLACLKHRRKRPDLRAFDRALWALLSRFWPRWKQLLVMVKPATVVGWHRKGFKLFWTWKSRHRGPGRPCIHRDIRKLIVEMATSNVGWGAPRIHGELLKLGIDVCETTVSRHMPRRLGPPGSRQRWATFFENHLHETLAVDFAVVPSITFEIMYVFFVLSLERRRVLHFNVTKHPTAEWTAQQVVEACPYDLPGRFLIRDSDKIYGAYFAERLDGLGLKQVRTAFRSPWQNAYAERFVGSVRRECLSRIIPLGEAHLRRLLREYLEHCHLERNHQGFGNRLIDPIVAANGDGPIRQRTRNGGLLSFYTREAA